MTDWSSPYTPSILLQDVERCTQWNPLRKSAGLEMVARIFEQCSINAKRHPDKPKPFKFGLKEGDQAFFVTAATHIPCGLGVHYLSLLLGGTLPSKRDLWRVGQIYGDIDYDESHPAFLQQRSPIPKSAYVYRTGNRQLPEPPGDAAELDQLRPGLLHHLCLQRRKQILGGRLQLRGSLGTPAADRQHIDPSMLRIGASESLFEEKIELPGSTFYRVEARVNPELIPKELAHILSDQDASGTQPALRDGHSLGGSSNIQGDKLTLTPAQPKTLKDTIRQIAGNLDVTPAWPAKLRDQKINNVLKRNYGRVASSSTISEALKDTPHIKARPDRRRT